ncbi:MAG: 4Fe-4S dicluster domain-containing protein [Bellilinea sp.]
MAEERKQPSVTRRGFLKILGVGGTAAVALNRISPVEPVLAEALAVSSPLSPVPGVGPDADVLIRMQEELRRALEKKPSERRWAMVIDLRKCVGCHACTIACVAENKLPPGVVYRPVLEKEIGSYPNVSRTFVPRPCMQCENPPCTPVCPVHATFTNEEGIVVVDYEQCIGCRACIAACPYGARTVDFGYTYAENTPIAVGKIVGQDTADDYERAANDEYGKSYARPDDHGSPIGNVRKCHFCLHRLREGQLPACTTTCIGRATLFGDANDPTSLVAEMISKPNIMVLKEELGTKPRVFYLI